jgi:predicted NUDIX family NTP pyrophosphohydrolase
VSKKSAGLLLFRFVDDQIEVLLLTRQQNIASRHPRLSGIGRRNKLKLKKDSGQAGMTELGYLLAGVIVHPGGPFWAK